MSNQELKSDKVDVEDSIESISSLFYSRGWTDGLPIIPPTEERVQEMLRSVDRDPQEVVGIIPPRWGVATVEQIAINAVMAGCCPAYLRVVVAAVEALADEMFNLLGVQATTNPVHPLLVINGPIVKELDINFGCNCLGPGNRANATIGRAIRLILLNIGGGMPGVMDKSTMGQPGKYTFCFGENEERNPWLPLHVERGFDAGTSTVTVFGAGGITNIIDMHSYTGLGILTTVVNSMTAVGTNNMLGDGDPLVIFCPEHAEIVARDDFSKDGVKRFLYENARVSLSKFSREVAEGIMKRRQGMGVDLYADAIVAPTVERIHIVVAGGAGPHSAFVQTALAYAPVTKLIR